MRRNVLLVVLMDVLSLNGLAITTFSSSDVRAASCPTWVGSQRFGFHDDPNDVTKLQQDLQKWYYSQPGINEDLAAGVVLPPPVVDSQFGQDTYNTLMDFQAVKQLSVDGIAGPQTWKALGECFSVG